jgi:hypothetical protein
MGGPVEVLGPILEMMTWVGLIPGVPLLVTAWIIARRRCQWETVDATTFTAGGFPGLRWTSLDGTQRQVLLETAPTLQAQDRISVYYDVCHPARWSTTAPKPDKTVLLLGLILTGIGLLSTLGGFVLLFF